MPNNLYHYGERYYDPTTGRWTQRDPAGSSEPYAFASDDPINEVAPTGEAGMAGSEKAAAESTVRWCIEHPHEFYYNRAIYERCEKAGEKADLPEDNCQVAGTFIFLLGGLDVLPAAASKVLWLLGGGSVVAC